MPKTKSNIVTTEDVLVMLCSSVTDVLSSATGTRIQYSPMVQKINRTCLRPDIGCFVLFDGGFAGLVVINFSAAAAMGLYRDYMKNMGLPDEDLASQHTSDDVSNVLGELMNQIVGDFTGKIGKKLLISINQNQPKMLSIKKEVMVSINTNLDRPQIRRVSFSTSDGSVFYLELAMDKTEFLKLHDFEHDEFDPDDIIDLQQQLPREPPPAAANGSADSDALLDELGI